LSCFNLELNVIFGLDKSWLWDIVYVWSKVVCFVLFVTMRSPKPCVSCWVPGIFGKLLWVRMGTLTWFESLFGAMVYKLLTIEPFSQWIFFENWNLKIVTGIWGLSWCCWKALREWVRSNWVYFTIFRAKAVKDILIHEWILLLEIQKNRKNWVYGKKNHVKLSMCSHLGRWDRLH
jgi:hypothetical protein